MAVEFVLSALGAKQFPRDRLPEIAFVGRSNVGKSSLLNTLLVRRTGAAGRGSSVPKKVLARTSRTPGRTRAINFFRIDRRMYFVDLPGYGYAKVPDAEQRRWKDLAEAYLARRDQIRLVVLIVDIRHGPTALDEQMREWLAARELHYRVVASKSDKLKRGARLRSLAAIRNSFASPIPFSAITGEGTKQLWRDIQSGIAR